MYHLELLKQILDFFKGHKEKVVKIEDTKAYRDAISKIDSPELKDSEIIKEFKDSTITINKTENNIIFIISKDNDEIIDKLTEILKAEKDKSNGTKVNILPTEEKVDYLEFKHEEKALDKKYTVVLNRLNEKHKALLALAINIADLYDKEPDIADANKRSVAEKYGDFGLKFCNLWAQGYLKNIFLLLAESINSGEQDKINVDSVINSFINEADSIEFVHQHSDIEKTAININASLTAKKDYVAVHGLGSTTYKVAQIIEKIKEVDGEYKVVSKGNTNKLSKIWYKGEHGSYVYSLVEKLL